MTYENKTTLHSEKKWALGTNENNTKYSHKNRKNTSTLYVYN